MKVICFHNPNEENGYLSNWYYRDFIVEGHKFISMEHYFMFQKAMLFNDIEIAEDILNERSVARVKQYGREIRNFDSDTWDRCKTDIIYKGIYEKFYQNLDLKEKLLSTGETLLAECAVKDRIWGIGLSMTDPDRFYPARWNGQNLLGKILMQVRSDLREGV